MPVLDLLNNLERHLDPAGVEQFRGAKETSNVVGAICRAHGQLLSCTKCPLAVDWMKSDQQIAERTRVLLQCGQAAIEKGGAIDTRYVSSNIDGSGNTMVARGNRDSYGS